MTSPRPMIQRIQFLLFPLHTSTHRPTTFSCSCSFLRPQGDCLASGVCPFICSYPLLNPPPVLLLTCDENLWQRDIHPEPVSECSHTLPNICPEPVPVSGDENHVCADEPLPVATVCVPVPSGDPPAFSSKGAGS